MTGEQGRSDRRGALQAVVAFALAATTGALVAIPTSSDAVIAARLVLFGIGLFGIALAVGSNRLIGLTSIPVLGGATIAVAVADDPAWLRTIIVGCLWYVTVELAWDAVEQREDGIRSRALDRRRIHEVATVVTLALVVGIIGVSGSGLARPRTLLVQAPIVVALLVLIGAATAALVRSRRPAR